MIRLMPIHTYFDRQVSVSNTQFMTKIMLDETQDIDHALWRLHQQLYVNTATRWYKKRYGYYEKPSLLRRKKRKMKRLLSQRQKYFYFEPAPNLWLKIEYSQQFARTGENAVGH